MELLSVSRTREFGLDGVDLIPGDHLCAVYLGQQERDDVVLPYLREGLRDGDKCIAIVDSSPLADFQASIGDKSEVDGYLASHQLELYTPDETYLRTLPFESGAMIDYWESNVGAVLKDGSYAFARAFGEMPLRLRDGPARAEFFRYEAALNRYAPRYPQSLLCLYDLERFGGGILVDLLRTHPKVLMGGLVLENPHYRAPDDLATRPN